MNQGNHSMQPPSRKLGALATIIGLALVFGIAIAVSPAPSEEPQRILSIGLALATGDLGDRAFNDSAYAGLQQAQRAFGIRFRVAPWKGSSGQYQNLRELAEEQHDLIIAIGQENTDVVAHVAQEYPQQRFAIIDSAVDAPNVSSIVFRETEGDYVAGVLSALLSPDGTVGFLGGADIPLIRRIEYSWAEGVRSVNPQAQILSYYVAGKDDFSGFNNPDKGLLIAQEMYERGARVIYAAAGRSALGAISAAQEQKRLVITTGSDQRWIAPSVVVTSRTKNMDAAVVSLIADLRDNTLQAGIHTLDLSTNGVSLAPLDGSGLSDPVVIVPPDIRMKVRDTEQALIEGTLQVREYSP